MAIVVLLSYILNFALIFVIVSLLIRVKQLERKLINFTPTEAYTIMENMREMIVESERLAHNLESSIKERESVLEDLSDLVDEKLARLNHIQNNGGNVIQNVKNNNTSNNIAQQNKEDDTIQPVSKSVSSVNNQTQQDNNELDIKAKIIALHKSGKNDSEIAKELSISVTEVRLVVSLVK